MSAMSSFITALSKRLSSISPLRQFAPSTRWPAVLCIMKISVERSTEIAQSIKSGVVKHVGPYMRCSIGIAPNRYLAKVGTELQKPDGLVVLRAEDLPQKLFGLKLRDLPG